MSQFARALRALCSLTGRVLLISSSLAGCALGSSTPARPTPIICQSPSKPSASPSATAPTPGPVSVWMTTPDRQDLLAALPAQHFSLDTSRCAVLTISIDDTVRYQQMDGFGASLTDTSAYLIAQSAPAQRDALMRSLFDPGQGIGISFLRQPMGASDFIAEPTFWTYDDLPSSACPTQTSDPTLACFSLAHDSATIALLQQALQLNPVIKVMSSPWSAPAWMKTTNSITGDNYSTGGTLLDGEIGGVPVYQMYAEYFVKYIEGYQALGIPIYALTMQNEPGALLQHNPGMDFQPAEQITFLEHALVPALEQANLHPRILLYDWNYDANNPSYPYTAFFTAFKNLPASSLLIAGTSVHCYGAPGDLNPLPSGPQVIGDLYETECAPSPATSVYAATPANPLAPVDLVIDGARDGARSIVMWNIAEDQQLGPRPQGKKGCPCIPLVTVTTDQHGHPTGDLTYTIEYYTLGQASKFVVPGAARIASPTFAAQGLKDVAFQNPDGSIVVIVHNSAAAAQPFKISWRGQSFLYTLPAGAAATFVWQPGGKLSSQTPSSGH